LAPFAEAIVSEKRLSHEPDRADLLFRRSPILLTLVASGLTFVVLRLI
jgi:hypothetical protein